MPSGNSFALIFYGKHRNKISSVAHERKILVFCNHGLEHQGLCDFCQKWAEGLGLFHHLIVHYCIKHLNTQFKSISQLRLIILTWQLYERSLPKLYEFPYLFGWESHPSGSNSPSRWGSLCLYCPVHPHSTSKFWEFCLIPAKPNGTWSPWGFLPVLGRSQSEILGENSPHPQGEAPALGQGQSEGRPLAPELCRCPGIQRDVGMKRMQTIENESFSVPLLPKMFVTPSRGC